MPCHSAVVDDTHVSNVVHYIHAMSFCCCWRYHVSNVVHYIHAMSFCCCWRYPCKQRCTLYTCHVLLLLLTIPCKQRCTLYTCHVILLLLTIPMYATLYTIYMPCLAAVVDDTHVRNVVHYIHAMSCCCCWRYPCTQRCTLYTCHVLLLLLTIPCKQHCTLYTCHVLLLLLTISMYATLYTIYMPCLAAVVDDTHVRNVVHYIHAMSCCCCWRYHVRNIVHYIHAMSCCCCWRYPCTQRCTLYTCHVLLLLLTIPMYATLYTIYMPCLAAVVDDTHVRNVVHYIHAMSCCCCWRYPCTQRCTLYTCHVLLLLLTIPCKQRCTLYTCHVLLLLLTIPMYATLYTIYMPCLAAVVDDTHVSNVVHYIHAMSCCCCWRYPCKQRCTLYTCHVLLLLLTIPMYATLYTIYMPCLAAVVDDTHVSNVVHYIHAMSCCCCWRYPCTQRCTLYTCHVLLLLLTIPMYATLYTIYMPCLAAVVDDTHVRNVVHYIHAMSCCCCWRYPCKQRCTLYTCHVLLLLLTIPMYATLYTIYMPCLAAVVDDTHVRNVVHYIHAMSCCCCWRYPCKQRCTLYTCHVLLLLLTIPMYATLYTIYMPCLAAVVDDTHVRNVVHYIHAMSCCCCWRYHVSNVVHYIHAMSFCCCWRYPCTQRCTLYTCHVLLLLLTIPM